MWLTNLQGFVLDIFIGLGNYQWRTSFMTLFIDYYMVILPLCIIRNLNLVKIQKILKLIKFMVFVSANIFIMYLHRSYIPEDLWFISYKRLAGYDGVNQMQLRFQRYFVYSDWMQRLVGYHNTITWWKYSPQKNFVMQPLVFNAL